MVFQPDGLYSYQIVTVTSTPITIVNRTCYICKAGTSPLKFQLPAACLVGFEFKIMGHSNLWQILQNANQFCKIGVSNSTLGVSGGIQANTVSDQIWVFCVTQNIEFDCFPAKGNPTIT